MREKSKMFVVGGLIGVIAVALVLLGNPKNMGVCVACFLRDIAGALGLHRAEAVQYIRPEIIGIILGAFIPAFFRKEFLPRGGSAPITRFVISAFVMIGALVFLGCPQRMLLRMAGGDLNAIVGLFGFTGGIFVGVLFLKKGYSLRRTYSQSASEGAVAPVAVTGLFALLIITPVFLFQSTSGPGSMHAPVFAALVGGLIVGVLGQRSRLCMAGGIRDIFLFRDGTLLMGALGIAAVAFIGNLLTGHFHIGMLGQPIAHIDSLWNFLGMLLVGFGSVLLGGCPFRQLIMAGEGNSDSAVSIAGFIAGAAFSHNFGLVSSASALKDGVLIGGPTAGGKIAVLLGLAVLVIIALYNSESIVFKKTPQTVQS